jgi:hypothetical protein
MLQSLNKAVDKIKGMWQLLALAALVTSPAELQRSLLYCPHAEKAAEVRAQAADAAAARAASGQADLPADSRSASIHLCGFDIQGVSIAGQVGSQQEAATAAHSGFVAQDGIAEHHLQHGHHAAAHTTGSKACTRLWFFSCK